MQILPVLDLLQGVVVRGVAGDRDNYRPIQSRLTESTQPLHVAGAIREKLRLSQFYVADLDAITRQAPNWQTYRDLSAAGFELWIDAGLTKPAQARQLLASGAGRVIVGLESCPDPRSVQALCDELGTKRVVFSLDLRDGVPLGNLCAWETKDPYEIALRAISYGVTQLIVLDLAQVGVGAGLSTLPLCRRIRSAAPEIELITGGGVRNAEDLDSLREEGLAGVLIASALHDGRLTAADLHSADCDAG